MNFVVANVLLLKICSQLHSRLKTVFDLINNTLKVKVTKKIKTLGLCLQWN